MMSRVQIQFNPLAYVDFNGSNEGNVNEMVNIFLTSGILDGYRCMVKGKGESEVHVERRIYYFYLEEELQYHIKGIRELIVIDPISIQSESID